MSKGVLFVILAQTRFMEITCLIRYDSSPASYHVTANKFKFTTSLIWSSASLHFPMCYLCCLFFFFPSCQATVTPPTNKIVAQKNIKGPNSLLAYAHKTSARM